MTQAPKIGLVSLGCPKALVDSERILTTLRAQGYAFSRDYEGSDIVIVNTCGFLDSAKEESLEAIGEAIAENGRVIVTGCMGEEADVIRARFPQVLAVTGAHQYEAVVEAVHEAAPPGQGPFVDLIPQPGALNQRSGNADEMVKLTPRHYEGLIEEKRAGFAYFRLLARETGVLAARTLREHPEAKAQGPDLDLADTWITRADRMLTDEDRDEEHLALMLDAIEGQLVMVRTSLTRRDAERRLEAERADYATRSGEINTLRQDNDAALRAREDATTKETP